MGKKICVNNQSDINCDGDTNNIELLKLITK